MPVRADAFGEAGCQAAVLSTNGTPTALSRLKTGMTGLATHLGNIADCKQLSMLSPSIRAQGRTSNLVQLQIRDGLACCIARKVATCEKRNATCTPVATPTTMRAHSTERSVPKPDDGRIKPTRRRQNRRLCKSRPFRGEPKREGDDIIGQTVELWHEKDADSLRVERYDVHVRSVVLLRCEACAPPIPSMIRQAPRT